MTIVDTLAVLVGTPIRRPGRPRVKHENVTQERLIDKITAAVSKGLGEPVVYASTTKGGMKLIYDGHHFTYSFRKGQYSIFQCCYKENKEQCRVRVVSNQKRVFHLDGEHVHFIQATDKSVTSLIFEAGEISDENPKTPVNNEDCCESDKITSIDEILIGSDNEVGNSEQVSEAPVIPPASNEEIISPSGAAQTDSEAANFFREKIKKRLQKALLGKKK